MPCWIFKIPVKFYRNLGKVKTHRNLVVRHFSNEIPALLQNADLAISRAGSGAICELIATKTPSILIPFPQSADSHQEFNAAYMARFGGSIIVHQHDPEEHILQNIISKLLTSNSLMKMKFNMHNNQFINNRIEKLLKYFRMYNLRNKSARSLSVGKKQYLSVIEEG